jgi:hypothetical protein
MHRGPQPAATITEGLQGLPRRRRDTLGAAVVCRLGGNGGNGGEWLHGVAG